MNAIDRCFSIFSRTFKSAVFDDSIKSNRFHNLHANDALTFGNHSMGQFVVYFSLRTCERINCFKNSHNYFLFFVAKYLLVADETNAYKTNEKIERIHIHDTQNKTKQRQREREKKEKEIFLALLVENVLAVSLLTSLAAFTIVFIDRRVSCKLV